MKLKHRSIRFKFFAAISIIALVFIGILGCSMCFSIRITI